MNRQQFLELLQQPELLNEQTLDQIKEVVEEYPFFQAGRMLWVKNLHNLDHIRYNNELKFAAAQIPDRARLFELLQGNPMEVHRDKGDDIESGNLDALAPAQFPSFAHKTEDDAEVKEDYFDVNDVFETTTGIKVDFSNEWDDNSKYEQKESGDVDNMVLPSADLLGYETEGQNAYQLPEEQGTVDLDQSRSFSEWLSILKHRPVKMEDDQFFEDEGSEDPKKSLIDQFLQNGDKRKIKVPAENQQIDKNPDFSLKSLQENQDLMTETLANIYIKQEHFFKAIDIFEQLRLKYPEKNIYFARRIKELEEQINNQ